MRGMERKWNHSDCSDSGDSLDLTTALSIPILDFHGVVSAFMTSTPFLKKTVINGVVFNPF